MLEKKYNFTCIEKKLNQYWQEQKIYHWDKDLPKNETYVIDTPPPTVSGNLHMGHIFSYCHTDFIARFHRMRGKNVFYPIGFDDNGLPTERLVEKRKNIKAFNTEREKFKKICHEIIKSEEEKFRQIFKSIALSVDWNLEYRTISDEVCKLAQISFLDLVKKSQIYRRNQPILWDPKDKTALAQADVEDKEKASYMYDIRFATTAGEDIVIATTRPELLAACVAVFYNPNDDRYKNLKNTYAITPLFHVKLPILADENVVIEKGTGLVMCCTFGDTLDIEWWNIHELDTKIILDQNGCIIKIEFDENSLDKTLANSNLDKIIGLSVLDARKKTVELLNNEKLILKEKEISHLVKSAERSGAPLEILMVPQWFVKTLEHKKILLEQADKILWHPESMKIRLTQWINGLCFDWCISRQRFFGVPFPVWYSKKDGSPIFADMDSLPIDPEKNLPKGYNRDAVIADKDVMDTWAVSSISPQINSHAISKDFAKDKARHEKLLPADLRSQAHEIIRTWAFSTILKSYLHEAIIPWKNIMISGWCLAPDKSKMSKSKGNIISPEGLLKEYGADVVRYWAASARLGQDITFSLEVINSGKKLVNKIWNAAKFIESHIRNLPENLPIDNINDLINSKKIFCSIDIYILYRLKETATQITSGFEEYKYSVAQELIERFFLNDFCDNYLEIIKVRAYDKNNEDPNGKASAQYSLHYLFQIILKLFAPFLPYITEALYQKIYAGNGGSIHLMKNWPDISYKIALDNQNESALNLINLIRKFKSEKQVSIKYPVQLIQVRGLSWSKDLVSDICNVTNADKILFIDDIDDSLVRLSDDFRVSMDLEK